MFYSIRHLTRFRYSLPVSESMMELRMQPRSEGPQRCLSFEIKVSPRTRVLSYRDYLSNVVHHFDVPGGHRQLTIISEAMVDVASSAPLPDELGPGAWERLEAGLQSDDFWEVLQPSRFAQPTALIEEFAADHNIPAANEARSRDPLALVKYINEAVFAAIDYVPKSTKVDSPVDDALLNRKGVCQDYSHIMISLVRRSGIPCRYVSGYLFHRSGDKTRSAEGATHAWVEAWFPGLNWVGFDPTNCTVAGDRHVRTAVGRDYADVPPTRGLFKGDASSQLIVAVRVAPSDKAPPPEAEMQPETWSDVLQSEPSAADAAAEAAAGQQQQQQQ